MAKPRARLTDANDPLSSTDSVLAGFEQVSKSASQQVDNTTIQQVELESVKSVEQLAKKLTGQQARKLTSQEVNKLDSLQVDLPESRQPNNLGSQQVDKSAIRKSTFQLSEEILKRLDIFHLQLQLELGKADAPYKEVIVEEAIAQFLNSANLNQAETIALLLKRQETRS